MLVARTELPTVPVGTTPTSQSSFDQLQPGRPDPLGAHWDGAGTNFSVFSRVASRVDLCLFDGNGLERRIQLPERTDSCWHGYLPGISPGQRYGFRVSGPWNPEEGQRCNPAKLLLDPYARAIDGALVNEPAVLPYSGDAETDGDAIGADDNSALVPRSVVIDPAFDWEDDQPLRRSIADTVIYEMHVKGFSKLHPDVPPELRGTFSGLAHPASVKYLKDLGITAVELLPIHSFLSEGYLAERGLVNYWGYNSIAFFAPQPAYATNGADASGVVREFKAMVKALHAAGIEVILDVVYNHTAEGNHLGPMLSFRGLDNETYYRIVPDERRHYMDFTGCGNTMDLREPQTLRLVMDSLRYWITEMHVDGFRFDLAVALARGDTNDYDLRAPFLSAVAQDPVLRETKLIAEPWDASMGGYQVGNFPGGWSEWNGRFRDTTRDFWRGQPGTVNDLATRIAGSSDLYRASGRAPTASVNFVTAHDGFTLRDLVSYNEKHNEANGDENRDGTTDHRSWNLGAEGPTDDPEINARRARQMRNFLATLLLSHGVPMLLGGDEFGRTQHGNNNAFCQDNEIGWLNWAAVNPSLLEFTKRLIRLRQQHPAFRRPTWPAVRTTHRPLAAIAWFTQAGIEMSTHDWDNQERRSFGLYLDDEAGVTAHTHSKTLDRFYLMFNAALEPGVFRLPSPRWGGLWTSVLDTADDNVGQPGVVTETYASRASSTRLPHSLLILRCPRRRLEPVTG